VFFLGAPDPSIIPSGNALRILKTRVIQANRRHKDTLTSLAIMKTEDDFKDVIHDIGFDPFYIIYHCAEQVHLYRSYCKQAANPKLIIDATGSIVKKFIKYGTVKSKSIFLYEALAYDSQKKHSFTVTSMLSERHTNIAISNWLSNWIQSDVQKPKETVCDQSLALLSAIVKSFTQYTSLQDYIRICADLLAGKLDQDTYWVPQCFVRIDVAHFVKICSKWSSLKTVPRRVREIILRSIGVLIKCQSLTEIHALLLSLFIVITNESDGTNLMTNEDTPCETHKQIIMSATSFGFIDFEKQFEEIIATAESEDDARILVEEEFELQNKGLDQFDNPFQEWANGIFEKSKSFVQEGSGINPLYLPSLVPVLIKSMKLLPLWSAVMLPIFKYGDEVCSSAAIESNFKKLKNITMQHVPLPTNLETFLENHILSCKGASLIKVSKTNGVNNIEVTYESQNRKNTNSSTLESKTDRSSPTQSLNEMMEYHYDMPSENKVPQRIEKVTTANDNINYKNNSVLPTSGNITNDRSPSPSFYKLIECQDSDGNDGMIVTTPKSCNNNNKSIDWTNLNEEQVAVEGWNRQNTRKSKSYLVPNPLLRYLDINNTRNIKSLPILKNGSRFEELKSCKTKFNTGKVIFSNTCAFDSISSIIMVILSFLLLTT